MGGEAVQHMVFTVNPSRGTGVYVVGLSVVSIHMPRKPPQNADFLQ